MDGRRLVSQRRVSPAEHAVHLRAGGHAQERARKWWSDHYDDYDMYMQAGSAGELGRRHGLEQIGFWRKIAGASRLRRVLAASRRWTRFWPRSR